MDTREAIRRWREHDPHITTAEMARELGVSRQRVHQLLTAMGLPTQPPPRRPPWDPTEPPTDGGSLGG